MTSNKKTSTEKAAEVCAMCLHCVSCTLQHHNPGAMVVQCYTAIPEPKDYSDFLRKEHKVYSLTPEGEAALAQYQASQPVA